MELSPGALYAIGSSQKLAVLHRTKIVQNSILWATCYPENMENRIEMLVERRRGCLNARMIHRDDVKKPKKKKKKNFRKPKRIEICLRSCNRQNAAFDKGKGRLRN